MPSTARARSPLRCPLVASVNPPTSPRLLSGWRATSRPSSPARTSWSTAATPPSGATAAQNVDGGPPVGGPPSRARSADWLLQLQCRRAGDLRDAGVALVDRPAGAGVVVLELVDPVRCTRLARRPAGGLHVV